MDLAFDLLSGDIIYQELHLGLQVKLTAEGHSVRLVAIRASKQEAEKRRREHRAKAKEKGKTVSHKTLIRDGWHLMVTNISKEITIV